MTGLKGQLQVTSYWSTLAILASDWSILAILASDWSIRAISVIQASDWRVAGSGHTPAPSHPLGVGPGRHQRGPPL